MNKKLIGGIIGAVAVVAVVVLGVLFLRNRNSEGENDNNNNGENAQMENNTTSKIDGKTLVVYYSAGGNTKNVAEKIATNLDADTFEITPQDIYTSEDLDWTADDSRVGREHADVALREVALENTVVSNWAEYDTVFIGYPIWWGIAAWPVNGFVEANDFTGKTVIPFCTSASSGIGESDQLLSELSDAGDWQPGKRFGSNATDSEIKSWLNGLR